MLDFIVAALYLLLVIVLIVMLRASLLRASLSTSSGSAASPSDGLSTFIAIATPIALAVHAYAVYKNLFSADGLQLGFAHAASLIAFVTMLLYWLFALSNARLRFMLLLPLPIAIVAAALPSLMSNAGPLSYGTNANVAFKAHIFVSMVAHSLAAVSVLHAIAMLVMDRFLRRGDLPAWLNELPSLLELERVLNRLLLVIFALMTVTVLSGVFFSEVLYNRPFRVTHKVVFGMAAWLTYGVLLVGQWRAGWRGAIAAKWMIGAYALLLLSYFGSKFVLEVILKRT
jgi:ABC-type uncharacterized transport system permease subunit